MNTIDVIKRVLEQNMKYSRKKDGYSRGYFKIASRVSDEDIQKLISKEQVEEYSFTDNINGDSWTISYGLHKNGNFLHCRSNIIKNNKRTGIFALKKLYKEIKKNEKI